MIVRRRWTEFVLDSLSDQIEASALNKSLEWSCDLDQLWEEYKLDNWTNVVCQNSTKGFDHFLYSKISRHPGWFECVQHNKQSPIGGDDEWCSAWRRLMLNADFGNFDGNNHWQPASNTTKPRRFLEDRRTLWRLLNGIPTDQIEPTTISPAITKSYNKVSELDLFICHASTAIPNLLTLDVFDPCTREKFSRARRDVNHVDEIYERKWSVGINGQLKCLC